MGINMNCIKVEILQEICIIYDKLKAIYHSKNTAVFEYLKEKKIEINLLMKLLVSKKNGKNILNSSVNKTLYNKKKILHNVVLFVWILKLALPSSDRV